MGARREDLRSEAGPVSLALISAGAAQGHVARVAAERQLEVAGVFGAVGAMLERFEAGEACDVVILTRAQVELLASRGKVRPGSLADLGTVATAIAVRAGSAHPDVASEAQLRAALCSADALYFPDPVKATAGIHFAKVIDSLGIREAVAARCRNFPNGATSMREMAQAGGNPLGCTQVTEILATPGVELVGSLPAGFELATRYTAAVSTAARDAGAAADFVAALTDPSGEVSRQAAGFQAASPAA